MAVGQTTKHWLSWTLKNHWLSWTLKELTTVDLSLVVWQDMKSIQQPCKHEKIAALGQLGDLLIAHTPSLSSKPSNYDRVLALSGKFLSLIGLKVSSVFKTTG